MRFLDLILTGGMQLQAWDGNDDLNFATLPKYGALTTENETIRYTLALTLWRGKLTAQVIKGKSQTWGHFGKAQKLRVTLLQRGLKNLNAYRPQSSVSHAQVIAGRECLKKFALTKVRYYSRKGLVSTDSTLRPVIQPDRVKVDKISQ